MKGLSRSLRYFTLLAGEYIALSLAIATAGFLLYLLRSNGANPEAFPIMILFVLYLFLIIFSMGHYMIMTSLVIPFNCTRKSLFWGTQYMMLLIAGTICILLGTYFGLVTDVGLHGFFRLLPAIAGMFAASIGLGALLGGIILKFGRAAVIVMTVFSGILGGIFGFCCSAFSDAGINTVFITFFSENARWILLTGLAVLLSGGSINYIVLGKSAVTR